MSKHTELIEKLNDSIEALNQETRNAKNFKMSIFLNQLIDEHADEETLTKIIADIEKKIQHYRQKQ